MGRFDHSDNYHLSSGRAFTVQDQLLGPEHQLRSYDVGTVELGKVALFQEGCCGV